MEKEGNISHVESLELIQSMINRVKDKFGENGHLYLLWGWVVLLCSLTQFILIKFTVVEKHYLVWLACWGVVIYQVFYLVKKHRGTKVRTYTGDIIGFVWFSFAIAMFLLSFVFGRILGNDYYRVINPVFLVIYGIPTFLSGIILRFRPLVIGGISCWVLSIIAAFVMPTYQLLFLSATMIVAWIIPGYLLRSKYKKASN